VPLGANRESLRRITPATLIDDFAARTAMDGERLSRIPLRSDEDEVAPRSCCSTGSTFPGGGAPLPRLVRRRLIVGHLHDVRSRNVSRTPVSSGQ
jgi:hypothetical protein